MRERERVRERQQENQKKHMKAHRRTKDNIERIACSKLSVIDFFYSVTIEVGNKQKHTI